MQIEALEKQFRGLLHDWHNGNIDQATFETALEQLQFQDATGRYWMIGVQTGQWYFYEGNGWQPGNPYLAELAPQSDFLKFWTHPIFPSLQISLLKGGAIFAGIVGILFLSLLILPLSRASSGHLPLLDPSPRPPLSDGNGGKDNNNNEDDNREDHTGAIYGTVTDLSRQQPVAGVEVVVNGATVRTDTDGRYSITGLKAGSYVVSLNLYDQGKPAQGPIHVVLNETHPAVINLDYYSQPYPTDTPQPTMPAPTASSATTPTTLPGSGAALYHRSLGIMQLGALFVVTGLILLLYKNFPGQQQSPSNKNKCCRPPLPN